MYILSVDTTAKSATVCVAKSDEVFGIIPIAQLDLNSTATHSESLLPMIDKALELSSLNISDMDCFAITAGPGSFTGVRIGVSAIKGLAFALGDEVPCIPLSTLYCLALNAAGYAENAIVCPVMDARRGEFYNSLFHVQDHTLLRLCEDRAIHGDRIAEELARYENVLILGDGAEKFVQQKTDFLPYLASPKLRYQSGESVAKLGIRRMQNGDCIVCNDLSPKYLRLPQAEREWNAKNNK